MSNETRLAIIDEIESALAGRPAVAVATVVASGAQALALGAKLLVRRDGSVVGALDGGPVDAAIREAAVEALEARPRLESQPLYVDATRGAVTRRSQAREGDAQLMLEIYEAPGKLLVVGGGHVGLALATIGDIVGFQVTVVDDREEFANAQRFPMAREAHSGEIGAILDGLAIDERTHVVMVSRGHTLDELALRKTVSRGAAYVGMIGSRRRTETVLQHLANEGFSVDDLGAVRTPIGLDIGAETPEEIALSILGEILMLRHGGSGRPMRDVRRRATPVAPAS